jgi:heat-inducible transcriptional repressor
MARDPTRKSAIFADVEQPLVLVGPPRGMHGQVQIQNPTDRKLIVRGHAHLLDDLNALGDLERVRSLFDTLETKQGVIDLLGLAERAEGVRIFIGSENKLFSLSGSSTIIAPYHDRAGRIIGVIGVIGPTRLNYARVIPMVDYTAKVVSKLVGG